VVRNEESSLRDWLARLEETPSDRLLAAVGYVPFLCFLPIFSRHESDFARRHGKQSLVLLAALIGIWVIIWLVNLILGRILGQIFLIGVLFKVLAWLVYYVLGGATSLGYLVAIVIGAVQALAGKDSRIPFISSLAEQIPL
jgi:uncharacterized membrane protein